MKRIFAMVVLLCFVVSSLSCAPPAETEHSTVASGWFFDEEDGEIARNAVPSGANGEIIGAQYVSGVSGSALSFHGNEERVACPEPIPVNWDESFSVQVAFRTSETGIMRLFSTGNFGWTDGCFLGIGHGGEGRVSFSVGAGGDQSRCLFPYTEASFHDGQWHLVHVLVDARQKTIQIYVDGTIQNISKAEGTAGTILGGTTLSFENETEYSFAPSSPFCIGSCQGEYESFLGDMDEVCFFREPLSREEVEQKYLSYFSALTYAEADFSQREGTPLVKKFGLFESGLVPYQRTVRDFSKADTLNSESFRLELGMGNPASIVDDAVTGGTDSLDYHFEEMDALARLILSKNMLPYWAYTYTPYPLQPVGGDYRSQPEDLELWKEVLSTMAAHFKENGIRIGYQEIGNEPDCGDVFYTGTWEDYLELYRYGSTGLLEGDPDAVIGGPSTAWVEAPGNRCTGFLNYVNEHALPLDFFSMHSYGDAYAERVDFVRNALAQNESRFRTTSIHVNEVNSTPWPWNFGGTCDTYRMASDLLNVFQYFVEQNDVEVVSWAQFLESGYDNLGIINEAGQEKAAYQVFEVWSRMPVDRNKLVFSGEDCDAVQGFASSDSHRSSILIWNTSDSLVPLHISADGLPPSQDRLTAQHIGAYSNTTEREIDPHAGQSVWEGVLPGRSVVYLELNDKADSPAFEFISLGNSKIVRQYHFYAARGMSNYAYFDEKTWTARLGMGEMERTDCIVGVLAEALPSTILCTVETDGTLMEKDQNSLLGVRFDFETESGYQNSTLFYNTLYHPDRDSVPQWGTKALPSRVIPMQADSMEIRLHEYAPEDWTGRAVITFELQNAGEKVSSKITLRSVS